MIDPIFILLLLSLMQPVQPPAPQVTTVIRFLGILPKLCTHQQANTNVLLYFFPQFYIKGNYTLCTILFLLFFLPVPLIRLFI